MHSFLQFAFPVLTSPFPSPAWSSTKNGFRELPRDDDWHGSRICPHSMGIWNFGVHMERTRLPDRMRKHFLFSPLFKTRGWLDQHDTDIILAVQIKITANRRSHVARGWSVQDIICNGEFMTPSPNPFARQRRNRKTEDNPS